MSAKSVLDRSAKRAFDIAVSGAAIVILFPVLATVGLVTAIKFGGSPIYISERVGQNGKKFGMIKFRTFKDDIPEGSLSVKEEMQRLTGYGKFLKITSLDELPQLYNVFKGDMSIVGPRPHAPHEIEHLSKDDPLFSVRPGLTGPWQVASIGVNIKTDMAERIELGRQYAEQPWSLRKDLGYIYATFKRGFWRGHDGAGFGHRDP